MVTLHIHFLTIEKRSSLEINDRKQVDIMKIDGTQ